MHFAQLLNRLLTDLGENMSISEITISESSRTSGGLRVPVADVGGEVESGYDQKQRPIEPAAIDLDSVVTALGRHADELDFIVFEEFHRLGPGAQRAVVQLMKAISDRKVRVGLVITGTRDWGEAFMTDAEFKDYVGRNITPVRLPSMTVAELSDIITKRAKLGISVDPEVEQKLVWVASGYPAMIHRVMFAASVRWITEKAFGLAQSLLGTVTAGVLSVLPGGIIASAVVGRKARLKTAAIEVGAPELESALRGHVVTYESDVQVTSKYADLAADTPLRQLLDAYALSSEPDFDLEATATTAGLSMADACDTCKAAVAWFGGSETRPRPVAGLRPYLRAVLILNGDDRALAAAGVNAASGQ